MSEKSEKRLIDADVIAEICRDRNVIRTLHGDVKHNCEQGGLCTAENCPIWEELEESE